jgi:hypothetical protein
MMALSPVQPIAVGQRIVPLRHGSYENDVLDAVRANLRNGILDAREIVRYPVRVENHHVRVDLAQRSAAGFNRIAVGNGLCW